MDSVAHSHRGIVRPGLADLYPVVRTDAPLEAVDRRIYVQFLDTLNFDHAKGSRSGCIRWTSSVAKGSSS